MKSTNLIKWTLASLLLSGAACGGGGGDGDEPPIGAPSNAVARASAEPFVSRAELVTLDGSASSDPDGDPLQYMWFQTVGTDVTDGVGWLEGEAPVFEAPGEVETLRFELVVSDGAGASAAAPVAVNVLEDRNTALFVSADAGDDEAGDGSPANPYASLAHALAVTTDAQEDIYLMSRADGSRYDERDAALALSAGTSLYGGYDAAWERDVASNKTGIHSDAQGIYIDGPVDFDTWFEGIDLLTEDAVEPGENVTGLFAAGGSAAVYVHDNVIEAGDAAAQRAAEPGSSVAVVLQDLARAEVVANTIVSGRGGDGADGDIGRDGGNGARGGNASGSGRANGGAGTPGGDGGRGGSRGGGINGGGGRGDNGANARDGRGIGGSGGGGSGDAGTTGTDGGDGGDGAGGSGVGGDPNAPMFVNGRGDSGAGGVHGGGGGGGGGGGASSVGRVGGGGGGGGEGGEGGGGGGGGAGGGASIGLWVFQVADSQINDNTIRSGQGGDGGAGREGGGGGAGGGGGNKANGDCGAFTCGGNGGNGGAGGRGGRGGHGGDGGGGPSIAIYIGPNTSPQISGNAAQAGNGGAANASGYEAEHPAAGEGGYSFAVFDADTEDDADAVLIDNQLTAGTPGEGGQAGRNNND